MTTNEKDEQGMSSPEVVVFVCHNSFAPRGAGGGTEPLVPAAAAGRRAEVRRLPCSGKIDVVYLLRAFEGGARGVAIVTCPLGACALVEGNLRARLRVEHVGDLLEEAGLGRERLIRLHAAAGEQGRDVPGLIAQAIERLGALPENPLRQTAGAVGAKST
jgi:coenzyme F420-reducing hydrogenase delta subunit